MSANFTRLAKPAQSILKARIAHQFSRAAGNYDQAAQVQAEIAFDALQMLDRGHRLLLDIGCGTGRSSCQLQNKCEQLVAMDLAQGMVMHASAKAASLGLSPIHWLRGDAESLPLATASMSAVYSSMSLQWCANISGVCREIYRVLSPGGQGVLAIMCEGSMHELQNCWQAIDSQRHVNQFANSQIWHQAAVKSGFAVQCQQKSYLTWHNNVRDLLGSIKQIGANVVTTTGNYAAITRQSLNVLEAKYQLEFARNGRLPLTYQICFIQIRK